MGNTYTQISIHAVFVVKYRHNIITKEWRNDLYKYISGIITDEGCKSLAVGGWKDHVHIFFGFPTTITISDLMRKIKGNSSKWINKNNFVTGKFNWQEGYAAFSYSKSQRDVVIKYIMNQEEHHSKRSFKEEYLQILKDFDIEYDPEYIFEFFD